MKKHITLLSIILTFSSSCIFSQSLSNSKWTVFDTTGTFFLYFNFGADTLFYSTNNISYTSVSTYQTNANNFTIIDLSNGPCPNDTGHYTYLIQVDTLKFTLVNDTCPSRPTTLSENQWVRLPTGIHDINLAQTISMFPNPTIGLLTIPIDGEKNITVMNLQGQTIKTIKTETKTISLEDLPTGNYLVSVCNNANKLLTTRQIISKK
jgi:hypothetical protein